MRYVDNKQINERMNEGNDRRRRRTEVEEDDALVFLPLPSIDGVSDIRSLFSVVIR